MATIGTMTNAAQIALLLPPLLDSSAHLPSTGHAPAIHTLTNRVRSANEPSGQRRTAWLLVITSAVVSAFEVNWPESHSLTLNYNHGLPVSSFDFESLS